MRKKLFSSYLYNALLSLLFASMIAAAPCSELLAAPNDEEVVTEQSGDVVAPEENTMSENTEDPDVMADPQNADEAITDAEENPDGFTSIEESGENTESVEAVQPQDASEQCDDDQAEKPADPEVQGQSGYGYANLQYESGERANVTLVVSVPAGITEPCYVTFTNIATYKEFMVEAYASNDYMINFYMPLGTYMFTGGGFLSDMTDSYFVEGEKTYFEITDDTAQIVRCSLVSKEMAAERMYENLKTENKAQETAQQSLQQDREQEQTQNNSRLMYLLIATILLGIAVFIMLSWLIVQYLRKKNE